VTLELIKEKEAKALLIFSGNYADAGAWGILPWWNTVTKVVSGVSLC